MSEQTSRAHTIYANTSQLIAAVEPDFPSFLYCSKELHRATKVFRKGFDGLLTYAVKCNPSPHIIKQLHEEGLKAFDVASNMEMELVRDHGGRYDAAAGGRAIAPWRLSLICPPFPPAACGSKPKGPTSTPKPKPCLNSAIPCRC